MKIPPFGYEETFRIRTFEIDNTKQATVPALVQLMQEAAMQNVIEINLSVWDLEPHNISWVLLRKNLKILRLPILGEKIRIITYPAGFERFFTYRDYKVFDENNDVLAYSSTAWLLMDVETRRMTRIPDFIKNIGNLMQANAEIGLERPGIKVDFTPEKTDFSKHSEVNYFDLDFNNHLGNVHYLNRILDVLPASFLTDHTPENLDILYRAEALLGDKLVSEAEQISDTEFLHQLKSAEGKELMSARTNWRKC